MVKKVQAEQVVDSMITLAKAVTKENIIESLAIAKILTDATTNAFKHSLHVRSFGRKAAVKFFDGDGPIENIEIPEVKKDSKDISHKNGKTGKQTKRYGGTAASRVKQYTWENLAPICAIVKMKVGESLVITLKETNPNAPLRLLQSGVLNKAESVFGENHQFVTHQLTDGSGVIVERQG
jgi:hypothetical protein